MKKDNLQKSINNTNLIKLLESEQRKTSALIEEIIQYRCEKEGLKAEEVLLQLYQKDLISGSYIKNYLNINHYELLNLLNRHGVEYKVGESTIDEKEKNLDFLRSLLNE